MSLSAACSCRVLTVTVAVAVLALVFATAPLAAEAACPAPTSGTLPSAGGGFGTFAFCGGTFDDLLATSGCPRETALFFYNRPDGAWTVWVPGATVAEVNAPIRALFPAGIPENTIFTARCDAGGPSPEERLAQSMLLVPTDLPGTWRAGGATASLIWIPAADSPLHECVAPAPAPIGLAVAPFMTGQLPQQQPPVSTLIESVAVFRSPADAAAAASAFDGYLTCWAGLVNAGKLKTELSEPSAATASSLSIATARGNVRASQLRLHSRSRPSTTYSGWLESDQTYTLIFIAEGNAVAKLWIGGNPSVQTAEGLDGMIQSATRKLRGPAQPAESEAAAAPEGGDQEAGAVNSGLLFEGPPPTLR